VSYIVYSIILVKDSGRHSANQPTLKSVGPTLDVGIGYASDVEPCPCERIHAGHTLEAAKCGENDCHVLFAETRVIQCRYAVASQLYIAVYYKCGENLVAFG